MIGRIAVSIILPESNGSIDPDLYDWTEAEIEIVKKSINSALNWWASQNPNANVTFITEWHIRVPTGYEPISRPENEVGLWQQEILCNLGYSDENLQYRKRTYANDLRERL